MNELPHRVDPDGLTLANAEIDAWAPLTVGARCVDIVGCPALAHVDLRACGGDAPLHLTVQACPRLSTILLPEGRDGAVVHLDLGDLTTPVALHGPIDTLDGCFGRAGRFASEGGAHRSAHVGYAASGELPLADLVVHVGTPRGAAGGSKGPLQRHEAQANIERIVVPDGVKEAIVLDHDALTTLTFLAPSTRSPPSAHVEGCGRLARVHAPGGLRTLRLVGARALTEIDAAGTNVHVARGSANAETLNLRGDWDHVSMTDCAAGALEGTLAQVVEITSCPNLRTVRILTPRLQVADTPNLEQAAGAGAVAVDAESLRRALESGHPPRPAMADAMVVHLLDRRGPREGCAALQALHTVAPVLTPDRCWELRERIAARHQGGPGWRWTFEDLDLAQRGLFADLDLWWELRAHVPAARRVEVQILQTGHAAGLAALLDWRAVHPDRSDVLDPLLVGALTTAVPPDEAQETDRALGRTRSAHLERIAKRLVRNLDLPGTRALLDAFPRWTIERYANAATLDLLTALASASHDASRHALLLVADGATQRVWPAVDRARARVLVLQPATSRRLASPIAPESAPEPS